MATDPTQEFSQVEESSTATEPSVETTPASSAEAEVNKKMAEIYGRNANREQADQMDEEGITGPDNPDGDKQETDAIAAEQEKARLEEKGERDAAEEQAEEELSPATKARKEALESFDPNLIRVAKELGGWKQGDIEDFIASNPVLARVTFANMADGYNRLSMQYAQGVRQPQAPQQSGGQNATTQAPVSPLDDLLAHPEKFKTLTELAGREMTDMFIKPLLDERKAAAEDRQFVAGLRKEALLREINTGFSDVATGGFEDFYGKAGETTQEQQNNRFKVGNLADQIRAGAQVQNVPMSVTDAIKRAHLIVTADQSRAQVRKELTKQVQKRSTQLTARPTGRKSTPVQGRGDEAALEAVNEFWGARGG